MRNLTEIPTAAPRPTLNPAIQAMPSTPFNNSNPRLSFTQPAMSSHFPSGSLFHRQFYGVAAFSTTSFHQPHLYGNNWRAPNQSSTTPPVIINPYLRQPVPSQSTGNNPGLPSSSSSSLQHPGETAASDARHPSPGYLLAGGADGAPPNIPSHFFSTATSAPTIFLLQPTT